MATATRDKLQELLEDFGVAMLVTKSPNGQLRSRPMALADTEEGGVLWFMTQSQSGKIDDIADDCQVNVAMQSSTKYVSISGVAAAVHDPAKVDSLWQESWKVWFPKGPHDPDLTLLQVRGASGEYWDNSGASGIKYLIEAGKAYLSGTKPDVAGDPKIHGRVAL